MLTIYKRASGDAYAHSIDIPMPKFLARILGRWIESLMLVDYHTEWN